MNSVEVKQKIVKQRWLQLKVPINVTAMQRVKTMNVQQLSTEKRREQQRSSHLKRPYHTTASNVHLNETERYERMTLS